MTFDFRTLLDSSAPADTFVDQVVDLTGATTVGKIFDGCVVILNDGPRVHIEGCTFLDCRLVGDGWPKWIHWLDGKPREE